MRNPGSIALFAMCIFARTPAQTQSNPGPAAPEIPVAARNPSPAPIAGAASDASGFHRLGAEYRPKPWDNLGSNLAWSLIGWPLAAHTAAGVSTWLLLDQGVDAAGLRVARRQDATWNGIANGPGLIVGSFAPMLLPASLYFLSDRGSATGAVALQSVGIAFLYNNALKAATGRRPPEPDVPDPEGLAHGFRFGFLEGGLFNGWPSGHAMTNSSLAAGMASYHRDMPWAVPLSLAYSAYIGSCVTFGARGGIHWVSESVAGVLMGYAIGWTVGSSYLRNRLAMGAKLPAVSFHPVLGEAVGLGMTARLPIKLLRPPR
jgi:membrane-associated phospholipid phosphatase